jgi:pyruvate/2-oxoglutarate/acetoin dehydrogenase E1 component
MTVRDLTYAEAIREALTEALDTDPAVILLGEEIGRYGGVFRVTEGLQERFGPGRVRDTPIAETGFIGAAIGAALVGARPVVEIMFMDFIACAMDPIVNHAAKLRAMSGGRSRVPIVIRTQGGTGTRHAAQHSQMLESWFTHVPGLLVAMPSTPADAKGLLAEAVTLDDPVVFIEHRGLYRTRGPVDDGPARIPFGKALVRRPGSDLTIVATSRMVLAALEAAERLSTEGIEAEVIDPRTLVPLDLGTILDSVSRTHRIAVVHEEVERSGWGGELVAQVVAEAFDDLDAPPMRVATKNVPIPFGLDLERVVVPQVDDIAATIRALMGAG